MNDTLAAITANDATRFVALTDPNASDGLLEISKAAICALGQEAAGVNPGAQITMLKRGGAFDPGKIKAEGVKDSASFEKAIKRVSKKAVEY